MKTENKEKNNIELKESIKGIIGIALYFGMNYIVTLPILLLGIDYNNLSINAKQAYLIGYNLFTMILFFILYRKELISNFKDLKQNYKEYFKKYIKVWFIAIAVMYVSNLTIAYLNYKLTGTTGVAANEETIRDTLVLAPLYIFLSASLYAPFVEELTFRKSFKNVFKNNILFILISGLVFGGLHVFTAGMTWFDLLYLIPYCAPGIAFAYIFVKTNNILTTISIHFCHNTILMILELIFLSRGLL